MSRPQKKRYVCCVPENDTFLPGKSEQNGQIIITVDEYEAVRLIDYEGCTQEECAGQMHVSRTTVQGVYDSVRKKLGDALVNGKSIRISGGDYIVCQHYCKSCGRGCEKRCHKHNCCQNKQEEKNENSGNV